MDQAEFSPFPGQPERPRRRAPDQQPRSDAVADGQLDHPVVAGYDGSPSSRNALAYAAGLCQRLARPLLVVYVCPPGVYCEPLTGQVIGTPRDRGEMERWLLTELDEVVDRSGINV